MIRALSRAWIWGAAAAIIYYQYEVLGEFRFWNYYLLSGLAMGLRIVIFREQALRETSQGLKKWQETNSQTPPELYHKIKNIPALAFIHFLVGFSGLPLGIIGDIVRGFK